MQIELTFITADELVQSSWYRNNVIKLRKEYPEGAVIAIKDKKVIAVGSSELELRTKLASDISHCESTGMCILFRRI